MKPKNLLSQLTELEASLNNFSFEELSGQEAASLQQSFLHFKKQLEDRIWGGRNAMPGAGIPLPEAMEEVREPNTEIGFLTVIARELRMPLDEILGATETLWEDSLTDTQQQALHIAQTASRKIRDTVNELIEMSSLDAEQEQIVPSDFSIKRLFRDIEFLSNTLILRKSFSLQTEIDQNVPDILRGDPSRLMQILLSLIGNVIKYAKGECILLGLHVHKVIRDTHILEFNLLTGKLQRHGAEIYDVLATGRAGNHHSGPITGMAGLGLKITSRIVNDLGGQLFLRDCGDDQGFNLVLRLPFQRNIASTAILGSENFAEDIQILVMGNQAPPGIKFLKELKSLGCTPLPVKNSGEATNLMATQAVSLVFVDLTASNEELSSLIRAVRKKESNRPPAAVIGFAHRDTADARQHLVSNLIDDLLITPFHPRELHDVITKNTPLMKQNQFDPGEEMIIDWKPQPDSGINLYPVLEDCLGKMELLEELVRLFKRNALEFIGEVKIRLNLKDYEGVAAASEAIKCSLKMMRVRGLYALVEQILQISQTSRDIRHLNFLHQCFVDEYPSVEAAIELELEKMKAP